MSKTFKNRHARALGKLGGMATLRKYGQRHFTRIRRLKRLAQKGGARP